jgi:carbon storage regulator CsrA
MLVLTRRVGETVVITGLPGRTRELKVSVVELRDGRVRLGFEADPDVSIDRSEVWDRKNVIVPADSSDGPAVTAR